MSNKKSLVFLALLSTLFICTSCVKTDKTLGSQFVSDSFILKLDTAMFDVPVTNMALDSIQGYNTSYMMIGYLNDETFGYTSSGFATNIVPFTDSTYLGINPELVSVYIYLNVDSTAVIREDQRSAPQNFSVHKLTCALDTIKMYNTSISTSDYEAEPISVGSPVFFGDDSLKIYLSKEFGYELLATSVAEYDSVDLFIERIKGVYFTTDTPEVETGGGRMNYISIGGSTIYVKYLLTDPQRGFYKKDTTQTFALGHAHSINTAKTSSKALTNPNIADKLYIDSYDGIKPHIKGSDLKQILNTWISKNGFSKEDVLISRAALVFPYEFDSEDYNKYTNLYPQQIYPCKLSNDDYLEYISPLPEIYNNAQIGQINRSQSNYTCEITNYIQDLIKNDEVSEKDDLFICPILSYETASDMGASYYLYYGFYGGGGQTYFGMDNQNYRQGILNGSGHPNRRPTLELTYSILNREGLAK